MHGDDVATLLAALTDQPAYVLGNGGGAQIGLNLAARHPSRVHTLVAHEPPCAQQLPRRPRDPGGHGGRVSGLPQPRRRGGHAAVPADHRAGRRPARAAPGRPAPEMLEGWQRIAGNLEFFLAHGVRPLTGYVLDVAALQTGPARIVVGVGEASGGQLAHRAAVALG